MFRECRAARAADILWQISAATCADMNRSDRQAMLNRLEDWSEPIAENSASALYAMFDDERRVRLIGSCLSAKSDWLKMFPAEAKWLAEQGMQPAEAVRKYREWIDRQQNWRPVSWKEFNQRGQR